MEDPRLSADGKYFDEWKDRDAVVADYHDNVPSEDEIIYAGYTYEDYSGEAIVIFRRDGKFYENRDYHCSCNGLESWSPEETTLEALKMQTGWVGRAEALERLS